MFLKALRRKPGAPLGGGLRHPATAFLPMRTGDLEVVESFARPLSAQLIATGLGEVTGHRLRPGRAEEPRGMELFLSLATLHVRALETIGRFLDDLDAPVGSTLEFTETGRRHQFGRTEGVAIDLSKNAAWLDFAEAAVEVLGGSASYQGSREVDGRRRLYFYGENATNIASAIKAAAQLDRRIGRIEARRLT